MRNYKCLCSVFIWDEILSNVNNVSIDFLVAVDLNFNKLNETIGAYRTDEHFGLILKRHLNYLNHMELKTLSLQKMHLEKGKEKNNFFTRPMTKIKLTLKIILKSISFSLCRRNNKCFN